MAWEHHMRVLVLRKKVLVLRKKVLELHRKVFVFLFHLPHDQG